MGTECGGGRRRQVEARIGQGSGINGDTGNTANISKQQEYRIHMHSDSFPSDVTAQTQSYTVPAAADLNRAGSDGGIDDRTAIVTLMIESTVIMIAHSHMLHISS